MHRRLPTLIAKTGLATGFALLLSLGTMVPGAARASAVNCPEGTAPISDVDGNAPCAAPGAAPATPGPADPTPTDAAPIDPSPTPTGLPTPSPPTEDLTPDPPATPAPSDVPESTPAVVVPPPTTAPAQPEASSSGSSDAATTLPATPPTSLTPTRRAQTPATSSDTSTPTPAVVPPDPPANADTTGVIVPGDGPRLLWAVAAGASASGLIAAMVAFYLVAVRPFVIARRRPGALG